METYGICARIHGVSLKTKTVFQFQQAVALCNAISVLLIECERAGFAHVVAEDGEAIYRVEYT